jgi:hypothetical protein
VLAHRLLTRRAASSRPGMGEGPAEEIVGEIVRQTPIPG